MTTPSVNQESHGHMNGKIPPDVLESSATPTADAPGPQARLDTETHPIEYRLKILNEVAQAKFDGREQTPILAREKIDWKQVARWKKQAIERSLPYTKESHPALHRLISGERMAHAREHITKADRQRGIENRRATLSAAKQKKTKASAASTRTTPAKSTRSQKKAEVSGPKLAETFGAGSITKMVVRIATDRDAFFAAIEKSLKIIDRILG